MRQYAGRPLVTKAVAPRYAIVATLLVGVFVAWAGGDVVTNRMTLSVIMPEFIAPAFTFTSLLSIGLPFFTVTMASQNAPGFATMQASGYPLAVSPLIVATGGLALLLSPSAFILYASPPSLPPSARARTPIRMPVNAGWPRRRQAGFICWRGCSAGRFPG